MHYIHPCQHNTDADYIVLSSGLGGHAHFWKPQIEFLSQHFHVLSYDQEGCHADSELLSDHYSFQNLAEQVLTILNEQHIQNFHFIGHAIGSFIGAELAVLCASQHLKMLSLTCINAWDRLDPHTAKCFEARIHLLKSAGADAYVRAQALFLYPPAWISKHHLQIQQTEDLQLLDFPPLNNVLTRIRAAQQFNFSTTHHQVLKDVPIHLIANQDDFLVPVQKTQDLKTYFTHAHVSIHAHGGHASTVTEADRLNTSVLNFLMKQYSSG